MTLLYTVWARSGLGRVRVHALGSDARDDHDRQATLESLGLQGFRPTLDLVGFLCFAPGWAAVVARCWWWKMLGTPSNYGNGGCEGGDGATHAMQPEVPLMTRDEDVLGQCGYACMRG